MAAFNNRIGLTEMANTVEYSRGYQAGRKKNTKDLKVAQRELRQLTIKADERKERIYMQALELTLKHCGHWQIAKKTIDNAEGYCKLAKIFADNAITCMDS